MMNFILNFFRVNDILKEDKITRTYGDSSVEVLFYLKKDRQKLIFEMTANKIKDNKVVATQTTKYDKFNVDEQEAAELLFDINKEQINEMEESDLEFLFI